MGGDLTPATLDFTATCGGPRNAAVVVFLCGCSAARFALPFCDPAEVAERGMVTVVRPGVYRATGAAIRAVSLLEPRDAAWLKAFAAGLVEPVEVKA